MKATIRLHYLPGWGAAPEPYWEVWFKGEHVGDFESEEAAIAAAKEAGAKKIALLQGGRVR